MHSLRTNIVFLIWLEDILAYLFFLLSSSFQSSNLFFVLPHSSQVLRPNQMLSYIPHYFLENLWESYNYPYLVDAETKVLTETGLMSFSFDNSYMEQSKKNQKDKFLPFWEIVLWNIILVFVAYSSEGLSTFMSKAAY